MNSGPEQNDKSLKRNRSKSASVTFREREAERILKLENEVKRLTQERDAYLIELQNEENINAQLSAYQMSLRQILNSGFEQMHFPGLEAETPIPEDEREAVTNGIGL
jgi:hypothetical protein